MTDDSKPSLGGRDALPPERLQSGPNEAGQRILGNILALASGQVIIWLHSVGMTLLLPRYLGAEHLGKFIFALSFMDLLGTLAGCGIATHITKEISRDRSSTGFLVVNTLAMRVCLTLVACGLGVAALALAGRDATTVRVALALMGYEVLVSVVWTITGALQGLQDMRPLALVTSASRLILVVLTAFALMAGYDVVGVALVYVAVTGLSAVAYLWLMASRGGLRGRIDVRSWRGLISAGLPYLVWQSALLIYVQIDLVLLAIMTNDSVVGWYGAAYRIIMIPGFITGIVGTAVFPALSANRDQPIFATLARRAVNFVLLATIPVSLAIMSLARPILGVFGYPDEFTKSVPLVIILSLHVPLAASDTILGAVLMALDKQRSWAKVAVAAAILNPAVNLVLIPLTQSSYGNGAVGAAIVTVATELFMMVMGLRLLQGQVFGRQSVIVGIKCLGAGLIMVLAITLAGDMPLPAVVALGASIYGLLVLAFGAVDKADLRYLVEYVRSRSLKTQISPFEASTIAQPE